MESAYKKKEKNEQEPAKKQNYERINPNSTTFQLEDMRQGRGGEKALIDIANNSPQVNQIAQLQENANHYLDQKYPAFHDNTLKVYQKVTDSDNVIQRNLNTKGSLHGEKVDGNIKKVRKEVQKVIAENKGGEMLSDIGKLETSIASRKFEQSSFSDKSDPKYKSHQVRILEEEKQLQLLLNAREQQLANRKPKAKKNQMSEDGWTTV